MSNGYKVLDLFCGCGGMSWGLAKKGFEIVAGIDIWDVALKTYAHNHKGAVALNMDISAADPLEVLKTIGVVFAGIGGILLTTAPSVSLISQMFVHILADSFLRSYHIDQIIRY